MHKIRKKLLITLAAAFLSIGGASAIAFGTAGTAHASAAYDCQDGATLWAFYSGIEDYATADVLYDGLVANGCFN